VSQPPKDYKEGILLLRGIGNGFSIGGVAGALIAVLFIFLDTSGPRDTNPTDWSTLLFDLSMLASVGAFCGAVAGTIFGLLLGLLFRYVKKRFVGILVGGVAGCAVAWHLWKGNPSLHFEHASEVWTFFLLSIIGGAAAGYTEACILLRPGKII
jgi:hypothetical protein